MLLLMLQQPYTYYKASYTEKISMDEFACAKPPGRGYRYLPPDSEDVLLPAFHGLSYTNFTLRSATPTARTLRNQPLTNALQLDFVVENVGDREGAETILAFFRPENRTNPGGAQLLPLQRRLCGLEKVVLAPHATAHLNISISADALVMADEQGALVSMPGKYSIILSRGTVGTEEITVPLTLEGERLVLETLPPGI